MTTKHTAGPWRIADSSEIHSEYGQPICSIANEENSNLNADTANANAQLITAAPDLLEALQMAADWLDFASLNEPAGRQIHSIRAKVRAAIAKAEKGAHEAQ